MVWPAKSIATRLAQCHQLSDGENLCLAGTDNKPGWIHLTPTMELVVGHQSA